MQKVSSLSQTIFALTRGVHAGQIVSSATSARGGKLSLFWRGKLSCESVTKLSTAFQKILAADQDETVWTNQRSPQFVEARNIAALNASSLKLSPRLPVWR